MKIQWPAFMVILFLGMLQLPSFVGAHAYMELTSPKAEEVLTESPTGVWVQYSEPIDTNLSQLRLENEAGEVIAAEQYSVDNSSITLRLPPLDNGVYYVYWQILALDTHVTDGSFRFFVDNPLPPEQEEPVQAEEEPIVDQEPVGEEPIQDVVKEEQLDELVEQPQRNWELFSRLTTGLRIIDMITVMVIGGWLFFHGVLWRKEGVEFGLARRRPIVSVERWLYGVAFLLFICTSFGHIAFRAIHLTQMQMSFTEPIVWQTMSVLFVTTTLGQFSLLKIALAAVLLVLSFVKKGTTIIKGILIVGLLITFAYTGHGYHSEEIITHTMHMLAIVIWFGGLIGFLIQSFFVTNHIESLHFLLKRMKLFSTIALTVVVIIAITGIRLTDVYLESWNDLFRTDYGQILLWKLILFLFVIGIAAFHRFVWLPKLKGLKSGEETRQQIQTLFWGLRVELMFVIIILVIAGLLSTASPPADIHGDHHYYYH